MVALADREVPATAGSRDRTWSEQRSMDQILPVRAGHLQDTPSSRMYRCIVTGSAGHGESHTRCIRAERVCTRHRSDIDASAVIRRIRRPKSITSRKIRLSTACFVRFRLFAQRFRRVIDLQGERVVTVDSWVLSSGNTF